MKIAVKQIESEYIALWWFNALYSKVDTICEWIPTNNYCEMHQGEMTALCNGAMCDD